MTASGDIRRRAIVSAFLVASTLVLSACKVDLNTSVSVADNGSGTITVTAVADADAVRMAPELSDSLNLDDLSAAGWNVEVQDPSTSGGLSVVAQRPFANVDEAGFFLAQLSGQDGPLRGIVVTRSGGINDATYTFDGSGGLPNGLAGFADDEALAVLGAKPFEQAIVRSGRSLSESLVISLQVTLPGNAVSTDGVVAERADDDVASSFSWNIPVDGTTVAFAATTRDRDIGAMVAFVAARILLATMILLAAGTLLYVATVVHRRKQSTPAS
ncbi:MAG: hypothetical protein EBZ98_05495 [Actinobacteria bacterium]|nr:hypothetical protein [Acidimicrobiia bacterium]NDE21092.1 hypothetical protein [Actinomycetota bacterium]NDF69292.1 hypothetical protein [Actinomycetota bacterium]